MNYIKRSVGGVIVCSQGKCIEKRLGIRGYINQLCKDRLATYQGILNTTKEIFHYQQLCPVYINKASLLFSLSSIREDDVIFINYYEIEKITKIKDGLVLLVFYDQSTLELAIGMTFFIKQVKRCEEIINYLNKKSLESVYNCGLSIEI